MMANRSPEELVKHYSLGYLGGDLGRGVAFGCIGDIMIEAIETGGDAVGLAMLVESGTVLRSQLYAYVVRVCTGDDIANSETDRVWRAADLAKLRGVLERAWPELTKVC